MKKKILLLKQDSFNRNIKLKDVLKEKLNNTKEIKCDKISIEKR